MTKIVGFSGRAGRMHTCFKWAWVSGFTTSSAGTKGRAQDSAYIEQ
jgi:hypothetical protein